jgi:hypothetical protein
MKQTLFTYPNLSRADKIKVIVLLLFMGSLLIVLGFLVGMLLRQKQFEFSLPAFPVQATPASFIPVTASSAVPQARDCTPSTLVLGGTKLQIQDLPRGADGSLAVPGDTIGIAYRVAGTDTSPVFVLSPMPQNIAVMSTISIGSAATITGTDCPPTTYSLSAPQAGTLDSSVLANQPDEAITIFFPTVSSGAGFLYKGRRVSEPALALDGPTQVIESAKAPVVTNTAPPTVKNTTLAPTTISTEQRIASPTAAIPTPDYSEALAEIGVLDASLSLFRTSLKIEVSIYNFGKLPITLSESNVTLTQPDGTVVALKSSKPGMPAEIHPGETKTIDLNFETPSSPTAILKILTVEYDVDGY